MDFSFPFLAPAISGSSDNYPIRPSIWPLYTPTPYKVYFQQTPAVPSQTDVTTRVEAGFRCGTPQLRSGTERQTSALLGRPTPMHSRKKLQKKETSAPIPKKYLEYEVSKGVLLGEELTETGHPGQAP